VRGKREEVRQGVLWCGGGEARGWRYWSVLHGVLQVVLQGVLQGVLQVVLQVVLWCGGGLARS